MRVAFFIPGRPVPQARPRVTRNGSHTYTPKRSADAQKHVAGIALDARMTAGYGLVEDGPVEVRMYAYFAYPVNTPKKHLVDQQPYTGKPDVENVAKMVMDACTGILWRDDSQVTALTISKVRVVDRDGEGTHVEVEANR